MGFFAKFRRSTSSNDELADIVENLKSVLMAKRGYGSFDERFGLSAFTWTSDRGALVARVIEEVSENIQLFEPRVDLVDITEIDADHSTRLGLKIRCDVRGKQQRLDLYFGAGDSNLKLTAVD